MATSWAKTNEDVSTAPDAIWWHINAHMIGIELQGHCNRISKYQNWKTIPDCQWKQCFCARMLTKLENISQFPWTSYPQLNLRITYTTSISSSDIIRELWSCSHSPIINCQSHPNYPLMLMPLFITSLEIFLIFLLLGTLIASKISWCSWLFPNLSSASALSEFIIISNTLIISWKEYLLGPSLQFNRIV